MKISLSWLQEYLPIPLNAKEVAEVLTLRGLEVDHIHSLRPPFQGVVVAKVVSTQKHPEAEKLQIAEVDDGQKKYQVVCGASNCRPGILTAFAKVGAKLPSITIKAAKLRGVDSEGMLCAYEELGLENSSDGIIEFENDRKIGELLEEALADEVLEISFTPNLAYCQSVLGVAKELASHYRCALNLPKELESAKPNDAAFPFSIRIENHTLCPSYQVAALSSIEVGPSPSWLKSRLEKAGVRAINNVVDATNYTLLLLGQPLHAFDQDLIEGSTLIVRESKPQENLMTLDGKTRELPSQTLVIADEKKALAIAGIMGGQNSEVSEKTKSVLLESAFFLPASIRRSAKKIGLSSDASKRFERGVDPNALHHALHFATNLICQLSQATFKAESSISSKKFVEKEIVLKVSEVKRILGFSPTLNEIASSLESLGFTSRSLDIEGLVVHVPSFRTDVTEAIDLIGEIARLFPAPLSHHNLRYSASKQPHEKEYLLEQEATRQLLQLGLIETLHCDLIHPHFSELLGINKETVIKTTNPCSIDQSTLRPSLLPGFLETCKRNLAQGRSDLKLFEVGKIHFQEGNVYKEKATVGLLLTGFSHAYHWQERPTPFDFFHLKGLIQALLGHKKASFASSSLSFMHPHQQLTLATEKEPLGFFGQVHPLLLKEWGIDQKAFYAELNLVPFFEKNQEVLFKPLPAFPSSERDITITLKEETPIQKAIDTLCSQPSSLLEKVELIDLFRSEKLGHGLKNATFRMTYRDKKKTLMQEIVDKEHARLTSALGSLT